MDSIDSSYLKRNYNADTSENSNQLIVKRFFNTISTDDTLNKLTKFTLDVIAGRNMLTQIFYVLTRGEINADKWNIINVSLIFFGKRLQKVEHPIILLNDTSCREEMAQGCYQANIVSLFIGK